MTADARSASSAGRTVVVVGAGIFGVTAALALRARKWHVILVDPGPLPHPDAASTDISKMVRMDYGADDFYARLGRAALNGWERWNREWSWTPYHPEGFIILAGRRIEPGSFEYESRAVMEGLGYAIEPLTKADIRSRFPAWRRSPHPEGYFNPHAGWAESGRVVAELAARARAAGVEVREGVACESVLGDATSVRGVVLEGGERLRADRVLVAAGAWTPTLLPALANVMWATGQPVFHLEVDDPAAWRAPRFPPFAADIARTGWYGFPANAEGLVKVANHGPGVRVDRHGPREVTPAHEARLREFLGESLPALAEAPIARTRLCVYCDTFDGDFWIAPDPERSGLVVAAGGSGHGFKFAPILGDLIADAVEGTYNTLGERFRWRARGTLRKEWARSWT